MIVLLTDFGDSEYVGVVKGVIYGIAPTARIVDLCHSVSPQCIIEGSWILKCNYKYFRAGSVFCCVVDPGVGSDRKAIAVRTENYYFVGPDNGLFWETLKEQKVVDIRQIPVPPGASRTFHGRDVFAKASAEIEAGKKFESIGEKIKSIEKLELACNANEGMVVRIDRFGNVVTNIAARRKESFCLELAGRRYNLVYYPTYAAAPEGRLFVIEGSNRTLEISLKNADASALLAAKPGQKVRIL